jgi:CO/xanthine dehydrogenase FAD-binding subunit
VEEVLIGEVPSNAMMERAYRVLHESVQFRTSPLRATSEYRDHLAEVLLERVLSSAYHRADKSEEGVQ